MKGFVLLLCFLIDGNLVAQPDILNVHYTTQSQCEQAKTHPAVIGSYSDMFPDKQVVLVCKEIK